MLDAGFWPPARRAYVSEKCWMIKEFFFIQYLASSIQDRSASSNGTFTPPTLREPQGRELVERLVGLRRSFARYEFEVLATICNRFK